MITAEHRKPLVAFFLVFAAACLIMGSGLRTQVVEVLIKAGAPPEVITAVSACSVLGCARTSVRRLRDYGLLRRGPGARGDEGRVGGLHSRLDGGLDG